LSNPDDRPWNHYKRERNWKLLVPGWGGHIIDDKELSFIIKHLEDDPALRLWWGIPARWKGIPEQVIRRLAMEGSEDNLAHNRTLARPRRQSRDAA
jgi:hypothetical protein